MDLKSLTEEEWDLFEGYLSRNVSLWRHTGDKHFMTLEAKFKLIRRSPEVDRSGVFNYQLMKAIAIPYTDLPLFLSSHNKILTSVVQFRLRVGR